MPYTDVLLLQELYFLHCPVNQVTKLTLLLWYYCDCCMSNVQIKLLIATFRVTHKHTDSQRAKSSNLNLIACC